MANAGVPGSSKQKPYAGPLYSSGTKESDSKENMGPVEGPTSADLTPPDPLGYVSGKD